MRSRGMWGWCLVCCGKIQYKGKYNWKFICNILSILREGDRGKFPVRRSSSRIIEKYQAIHTYCAASGATYEYALDIFAALFVRVTASL